MKARLFLILFIGISLSLGCSRHYRSYPLFMEQAQSCMETAPDSALHYLSLLKDSIGCEPEETQMYYHLLTIKAEDKLYTRHISDSLINLIVKFYNEHGDKNKQIEAYYYQGSVYRDMNDAPSALDAFHEVISRSKELSSAGKKQSADLMARTYNQMGTLFAYQGLYDEALQANRESVNCYLAQGKENKIFYALRDIARMYDAKHQKDSALHYYQKAYRTALSTHSPHKAYIIWGELGSFYYYSLGKADSAKRMLITALKHQPDMANALLVLGDVYRGENRWDSACYYLHQAIEYGDIYKQHSAYRHLSSIEIQKHNYPQAITYIRRAQLLADSIKEITRTEAIAQINSLYNYGHTQKENNELQRKNIRTTRMIVALMYIVLMIIGGGLFYYVWEKQRIKEKNDRIHKLEEQLKAQSTTTVNNNNQIIKELTTQLEEDEGQCNDSLQQEIIQAQKACLEASNQQITAIQNKKALQEQSLIQSEIYYIFHEFGHKDSDTLKITQEHWEALYSAINTAYPDFRNRLYELCPKLSLLELQVCCLIKIKISPTTISILLNCSKPTVSNTRARLSKKIYGKEGNVKKLDALLLDL